MAKRYYSYEELAGELNEKKSPTLVFKPGGTLGRHHLQISWGINPDTIEAKGVEINRDYEDLANHVSNYEVKKYISLSELKTVKKGGSLGYNCGSVWVIRPISEMTPLQAFRHTHKLPREKVVILSDFNQIEIEELSSAISDDNQYANRNRFWGNGETVMYSGENCVITEYHSFKGGVDQRRSLHKVYFRKYKVIKGIAEANKAIAGTAPKTNIKHPANGLLFAP